MPVDRLFIESFFSFYTDSGQVLAADNIEEAVLVATQISYGLDYQEIKITGVNQTPGR